MKHALCEAYRVLEWFWAPLLQRREQPLVRFIDLFWSQCAYCLAYRTMVFGIGVGLLASSVAWLGVLLIALVVLLVVIERAACEIKRD